MNAAGVDDPWQEGTPWQQYKALVVRNFIIKKSEKRKTITVSGLYPCLCYTCISYSRMTIE